MNIRCMRIECYHAIYKEQRLRKYDKGNIQVSAYLRWCCTKKVEAMVVSLGI